MSTLAQSDFIRFPTQARTRDLPFKEWQHFVVQRDGLRILINFSLLVESHGGSKQRLSPQVIVLVHATDDHSSIDRRTDAEFAISPDYSNLAIGSSQLAVTDEGYRVTVDTADGSLQADIAFRPTSTPFIVNNQPVGLGRLSWLFVPQLVASGWLRTPTELHHLDEEIAYHDHNWGHMHWGDDFSWMWGSVLPATTNGWTIVAMRMTDRNTHHAFAQALYVWKGQERAAVFRDSEVAIEQGSPFGEPAAQHVPPIVRLLAPQSTDVPSRLIARGRAGDDHVQVDFTPSRFSRIGFPDELTESRLCLLDEASGASHITGTVNGTTLDQTASGFFEFCHG